MKLLKKGLVLMLMLFAFTSCSLLFPDSGPDVTTVSTPASFTRAQKRIAVVNGSDYVRRKVADQLSNRGWKVSGAKTGKETFAINFDKLDSVKERNHYAKENYDSQGFYRGTTSVFEERNVTYGYVSIYDLRTGKRLYVYDFEDKSEDQIVKGIVAAVIKLEENMR